MLDVEWVNQSALFLHVLAAIGLTSAGVVQVTAGVRVTQARTGRELASWSRFARGMGPVAVLVLAPIGPMLGGARLRRQAAAAADLGDGAVTPQLQAQATDPVLWGAVHSQVGLAVGFVWIMTNKPGWVATAVVLVGTFAAGWLVGGYPARRRDLGVPLPGRAQ